MLNKIKNLWADSEGKESFFFGKNAGSKSFLLQRTDYGVINVDSSVIRRVAWRAVIEIPSVYKAEIVIEKRDEDSPLKIHFDLVLEPNNSVESVSKDLVGAVKSDLEKIFAITDVEIYVRVVGINAPEISKKKRILK